jgi:polyphosphate glucokinase
VLVNYDVLYVGGGNAQHISFVLPPDVRIVPNVSGITGGIKLWNPALDVLFTV